MSSPSSSSSSVSVTKDNSDNKTQERKDASKLISIKELVYGDLTFWTADSFTAYVAGWTKDVKLDRVQLEHFQEEQAREGVPLSFEYVKVDERRLGLNEMQWAVCFHNPIRWFPLKEIGRRWTEYETTCTDVIPQSELKWSSQYSWPKSREDKEKPCTRVVVKSGITERAFDLALYIYAKFLGPVTICLEGSTISQTRAMKAQSDYPHYSFE